MIKRKWHKQQGMTIIELVITLTVAGILATIATVKLNPSNITVGQQAEQFANDIRHAQMLAISWGCELTLSAIATQYTITSKQSYSGKKCDTAGSVIHDPGTTKDFQVTLDNNVQFSLMSDLHLDSFGRPIDAAGNIISTDTVYELGASGRTWRITVSPLSGYVEAVEP